MIKYFCDMCWEAGDIGNNLSTFKQVNAAVEVHICKECLKKIEEKSK